MAQVGGDKGRKERGKKNRIKRQQNSSARIDVHTALGALTHRRIHETSYRERETETHTHGDRKA
jgi:hypothetical protein